MHIRFAYPYQFAKATTNCVVEPRMRVTHLVTPKEAYSPQRPLQNINHSAVWKRVGCVLQRSWLQNAMAVVVVVAVGISVATATHGTQHHFSGVCLA